jgi:hypothetical protein
VNLPGDKTEYMLLFSQQNARAKSWHKDRKHIFLKMWHSLNIWERQ